MFTVLVMFFIIQQTMISGHKEAKKQLESYSSVRKTYEPAYNEIKKTLGEVDGALSQLSELNAFLMQRTQWPLVLEEIFRAKPDNVWIDSIEPIFGETTAIERTSVVEEEEGAMGGGDDMFSMGSSMSGGSGGMGGDMMGMSRSTPSKSLKRRRSPPKRWSSTRWATRPPSRRTSPTSTSRASFSL